jgi:hypothetical protein
MEPLTREQLLANGKCCGNGCVNCPYPIDKSRRALDELIKKK